MTYNPMYSRQRADFVAATEAEVQPLVDLAQAWAEGTLPGGAGTKSAKGWSEVSEAEADAAALSAAAAQAGVDNYFATIAAGVAGTAVDGFFASAESGSTRIYKRTGTSPFYVDQGDAAAPATKALLAAPDGAGLVGFSQSGAGAVARTAEAKLLETVSVTDFGAVGDGTLHTVAEWIVPGALGRYANLSALQVDYPHVTGTDDPIDWAAIQSAINYAASIGSRTVFFPKGKNKTSGTPYNIGSKTISIPRGELKLVGQKYTQIKKTGVGAFFDIPVQGYGFEAEGLWLLGTNVNGQYGFLFSGEFNGTYQQGVLQAHIHDCWFEAVGKKETVDETAGGAILVTSQTLGLKVEGNICSQGGFLIRVEAGSDGVQIRHNVSNVSRSVAVQMINTTGAGAVEIAQNNLANVGGAVFLKNAGYCNVYGNESIPGESEAGALGAVVKRTINGDGSVSLTENAATGVSASFWLDLVQSPTVNSNLCAYSGSAQDADYGFYFSARQALAFVSNNFVDAATLKAIRVQSGQPLALVNNRTSSLNGGDVYSEPNHRGIIHNYLQTTPSYAQRQGFGTETPIAPFEFSGSAAAPVGGVGTVRVSNSANPNQGIALGWDSSTTAGYIYAYTVGVGYSNFRLGSATLVQGYSGDTSFIVQGGATQGSNIFRIRNNAGTTFLQVGPTGTISASQLATYADNTSALAGGLVAGNLYRTATGQLHVVY